MADMDCNKRICLWDQISELPDEILVSILSLLTLEEAARTSVLSSRWRYLWTFFMADMSFHCDEQRINLRRLGTQLKRIMASHRGMNIKEFKIVFDDNVYSVKDIDRWIEFVAKKRAEKFELTFGNTKIDYLPETFTRIRLKLPSVSWNFKSLKIVSLTRVNLIGGVSANAAMNGLLSNSPNLEKLYLHGLIGLSELLVPSSCLGLKVLSVAICYGLKKLEILTRSIEDFSCVGVDRDIEIKGFRQLPSLRFGDRRSKWRTLSDLMTHAYKILPMRQLERLRLDLWKMKQQSSLDVNQFGLPKLQHLHLIVGPRKGSDEMFSFMYLLEAAPILHTLEIMFCWKHRSIQKLAMHDVHTMQVNRSIKVVRVEQFLGLPGFDTQVVKMMIKSMVSLEKLIIVPYKEYPMPNQPTLTDGMKKQMNDSIAELCEKGFLPPGVELVIEGGLDN